jgi:hypothetical protein
MTRRASTWLLVAALAIQPAAGWAADLPLEPAKPAPAAPAKTEPAPSAAPPQPAGNNVFVAPEAGCLEWTDGCRVCQQPPAGEVHCSNVGLACTPQAPRCMRR